MDKVIDIEERIPTLKKKRRRRTNIKFAVIISLFLGTLFLLLYFQSPYSNIQKILDMRHKYIRLSLQGPMDDPRDDSSWPVYPPMPEPSWKDDGQRRSTSAGLDDDDTERAVRPGKKPRKMGQDIGEDFDIEDLLPVPGESEMTYQLDENGVFQVYETTKSAELDMPIVAIPTLRDFYMDLDAILEISSDGPSKSFAFRRLQYLEGKSEPRDWKMTRPEATDKGSS